MTSFNEKIKRSKREVFFHLISSVISSQSQQSEIIETNNPQAALRLNGKKLSGSK